MDRSDTKVKPAPAGVSVRNGPVNGASNGTTKRKSRSSMDKKTYKEDSDSEDGAPLVSYPRLEVRNEYRNTGVNTE